MFPAEETRGLIETIVEPCDHCGCRDVRVGTETFGDGTTHIKVTCVECQSFRGRRRRTDELLDAIRFAESRSPSTRQ